MSDQQHKPVPEQSSILDQTPSRSQAFKEIPKRTEIATTHSRRCCILDDTDFDVVLGGDVVGELFNRRIQQFDREQDEEHADHGHVPGRAR